MKQVRGMMEAAGIEYKAYTMHTLVPREEAKKWPQDGKDRVAYFTKQMDEYRKNRAARKKEAGK